MLEVIAVSTPPTVGTAVPAGRNAPALPEQGRAGTPSQPLKHVQVREYVRDLIRSAEPGTTAPSERELVMHFGVARMTVRQALDCLVAEGLLQRVPGRGTFVAHAPAPIHAGLASYTEDMQRRGLRPDSRTLLARRESAGPGVAKALSVDEGTCILHWQRLRLADGEPMCIEDAYIVDGLVQGLLDQPLPASLYAELRRRGIGATSGEDSIEADRADAEQARLLGVSEGAAVLRIARRTFTEDLPVVVSRTTYRADRYTLWVPLARSH